ncbi:MAG: ShlB/FhaC/HecB family hemolysin secretion/activation protein, partial [Gammaproteobacteria bacterium]
MKNILFKFNFITVPCTIIYSLLGLAVIFSMPTIVFAVDLSGQMPGSTDAAKFKSNEQGEDIVEQLKILDENEIIIPDFEEDQYVEVPKNAGYIKLFLKDIKIEGMTLFSKKDVIDLYLPHLYKEITLDLVYKVAEKITSFYRKKGYFISKAYLPSQRINKGIVTIKVIEGYIGKVELEEKFKQHYVIQEAVRRILTEKPLNIKSLESLLLRLNDLPGYYFKSTLKSLDGNKDGAILLHLNVEPKKAKCKISLDNFYSRFTGPQGLLFSYSDSLLPLQQTTISSIINKFQIKKLSYLMFNHAIAMSVKTTFDLSVNSVKSYPEYVLKPLNIKSLSDSINTGISYKAISQRDHNLDLKFSINIKNSNSYTNDILFTRDKIRVLRTIMAYDVRGNNNYSTINFTMSNGIKILQASKRGEDNISRAHAKPNFNKIELFMSYLRKITTNCSLMLSFSGQYADSSVFSSEEFGYGGQTFGRAFDSNEISGDHGLS